MAEVKFSNVKVVEGKVKAVGRVKVSHGISRVPVKVGEKWVSFTASSIKELKSRMKEISLGDEVRIECLKYKDGGLNRLLAVKVGKVDSKSKEKSKACSGILEAV